MGPEEHGFFRNIFRWVFPKIGVPENGWFIVENPIKMDDLEVLLFLESFFSKTEGPGAILENLQWKVSSST